MPRHSRPRIAGTDRIDDLAAQALSVVASRSAQMRAAPIDQTLLDRFVEAAMGRSAESHRDVADQILAAGVGPEGIVDDYIPAAARRMGDAWEGDTAGFAQVTLGTSRLQSLLREISETWDVLDSGGRAMPSVLVAVPLGAQHTLGASVLVTQLRRAGLSVRLLMDAAAASAARAVAGEGHEIVMISASFGDSIDMVRQIVHAAVGDDPARRPKVIVGGTITIGQDDICDRTGADLATIDVREALRFCNIELA